MNKFLPEIEDSHEEVKLEDGEMCGDLFANIGKGPGPSRSLSLCQESEQWKVEPQMVH